MGPGQAWERAARLLFLGLCVAATACGGRVRSAEEAAPTTMPAAVSIPDTTTSSVPPEPTSTVAAASASVVTVRSTLVTTTSGGPVRTVPPAASTTTLARTGSGVSGTARFSPVCPVERVPPAPQCAPRGGAAQLTLVRGDGTVAARGDADADGTFSFPVAPGTYVVRAVAAAPSPGRGCQADPSPIVVPSQTYVTVSVSCDTGIR